MDEVAALMESSYVAAPGAQLRREDRRKASEVAARLDEMAAAVRRSARKAASRWSTALLARPTWDCRRRSWCWSATGARRA
jgi:hypothetical protein